MRYLMLAPAFPFLAVATPLAAFDGILTFRTVLANNGIDGTTSISLSIGASVLLFGCGFAVRWGRDRERERAKIRALTRLVRILCQEVPEVDHRRGYVRKELAQLDDDGDVKDET